VSSRRKTSWPRGFYSDGTTYRMKTSNGRFRRLGSNEARALRYRKGSHSIRINDQWRVVFVWKGSDAYEVEVVDYHR
jgi:plasmid maintenance system killer protein